MERGHHQVRSSISETEVVLALNTFLTSSACCGATSFLLKSSASSADSEAALHYDECCRLLITKQYVVLQSNTPEV
jgi:hypothetical protein